ncbi:unnamed protein product [Rhizoctonia solani]|uniref:Uncharacterized protein n=1 Tax=Rhizoctonia solani TaxID=456999 RepID=A0A8H3DLW9_9AGAM|nr:unnamed protein product [Rhizoctonia solani]
MRQTLILAQQYRNEMIEDSVGLINQLINEAREFYEWSPPPRPKSDRGTKRPRTGSEYSNPFGPRPENESMSVDPYEDSDCESDPEELESPEDDVGPTRRVVGEVSSYTFINYAYPEDVGACAFGNSYSAQPSVSQTV